MIDSAGVDILIAVQSQREKKSKVLQSVTEWQTSSSKPKS